MRVVLALNHRMEPNYLSKSSNDDDHAECYGSVLMEGFHVMTSNLNAPSILIFLSHIKVFGRYGAGWHRGNVRASFPAAPSSILSIPKNLFTLDFAEVYQWHYL